MSGEVVHADGKDYRVSADTVSYEAPVGDMPSAVVRMPFDEGTYVLHAKLPDTPSEKVITEAYFERVDGQGGARFEELPRHLRAVMTNVLRDELHEEGYAMSETLEDQLKRGEGLGIASAETAEQVEARIHAQRESDVADGMLDLDAELKAFSQTGSFAAQTEAARAGSRIEDIVANGPKKPGEDNGPEQGGARGR